MVQNTSPAHAWKRKTEWVEFPSGLTAEMTRPDALSLLTESDEIPDSFYSLMVKSQATGEDPMKELDGAQTKEFLRMMMFLAVQLAKRHFVSPCVVDGDADYDANQISTKDVNAMGMLDKQFLVNWAMNGGSPTELLARFRQEQAGNVPASPNGEGV